MKIEFRSVTKSYGNTRALDRASFEIPPGCLVALLGANGAGKTTLLRCLAGVAGPDSGVVQFDDKPFHRDQLDVRRQIMFLPDTPVAFWEMTVVRHIGMVLRLHEADRPGVEARVLELLREFDLLPSAELPLLALSRGQLYKACLVALASVDPEIWLLDEPFSSGMDPHGFETFKRLAREACSRGRTVVYSTQILEVAERFSDRVCILHKGEVRAFDTLEAVRQGAPGEVLPEIFRQLREEQP